VLQSGGEPIDAATRGYFEPRFQHDFSRVRIHTDEEAALSSRAVKAIAYTVGNHLVFGSGQYAPHTMSGQELLAHELAHVAQQEEKGIENGLPESLLIGAEDDPSEIEAETLAKTMRGPVSGHPGLRPASVKSAPTQLRRQADDESKKKAPYLLQLGDYGLDLKPILPLPVDAPSVEDVHQGLYNLTHKDKPEDLSCPQNWVKMVDGRCCEGKKDSGGSSVNLTKCCPPLRLTKLGTCCANDETAGPWGCEKSKIPTPPSPIPQGETSGLRMTLPPTTPPLTLDLLVHFNHDQPGAVVSGGPALQNSLTQMGQMELASVLTWMHRDPPFSAQLTGMASVEGPAERNTKLGEFRVRSVANALILSGVSPGRIFDPPGLPAECAEIGMGIRNCGADKASSSQDPNDRQVRVRVFLPPKKTTVDTRRP
jgi:hypothetical protein